MPGTNPVMKPEIKQLNWALADSATNTNRLGFAADSYYSSSIASSTSDRLFWRFYQLPFPYNSAAPAAVVGAKCHYLYARFKGYIHVSQRVSQTIRWRMVSYRTDDVVLAINTPDDVMNKLYLNIQTVGATSLPAAYHNAQHNFYKKVWNVNADNLCKHKVIASGVIPRTLEAKQIKLFAVGTNSQYQLGLTWDKNEEPYGTMNIPLDVKVKLNDNVDSTVHYYLCFESDCPIGGRGGR